MFIICVLLPLIHLLVFLSFLFLYTFLFLCIFIFLYIFIFLASSPISSKSLLSSSYILSFISPLSNQEVDDCEDGLDTELVYTLANTFLIRDVFLAIFFFFIIFFMWNRYISRILCYIFNFYYLLFCFSSSEIFCFLFY
jgi:hypothetical protein